MTIPIKSKQEIAYMRKAGRIVSDCLIALNKQIKVGMTTKDIDYYVDWFLLENGATATQKGYRGYKHASCISVNEVACHGVPSKQQLNIGDILTVDIVADVNGFKADSAWTYIVGEASPHVKALVVGARKVMRAGLKKAVVGNDVSEVGTAIEAEAKRLGLSVVTDFAGHGIGKELHELPQVLNFKSRKSGIILREGMVITVEPIVIKGNASVYVSPRDGWTVYSTHKHLSAQFEHTVLITKSGHEILTSQRRDKK